MHFLSLTLHTKYISRCDTKSTPSFTCFKLPMLLTLEKKTSDRFLPHS